MDPDRTKNRLAQALKEAQLPILAEKAAAGDYDEIESQRALPLTDLVSDLAVAAASGNAAAAALRHRVINGDFDATEDEWAADMEGVDWMDDADE